MADELTFSVDTRELERKLAALSERVARRAVDTALDAAGDVVMTAMKQLAHGRTEYPLPTGNSLPMGILAEDIQTSVKVKNATGVCRIGPGTIAGHVARWVNNGWALTTKQPKHEAVRDMPGMHFAEAALDETKQQALDVLIDVLGKEIEAAAKSNS